MSKSDAIKEFKRLFLEKTGNPWEAWEDKKNFQKQPGRFFPLDIVLLIVTLDFDFLLCLFLTSYSTFLKFGLLGLWS